MSDSRIARALAEYWTAISAGAAPELPSDPVDAFIEVVDRSSHERGAFHLLDASTDPYPGLAVGDRSRPFRIIWALQIAELEPFACDALPEITFYLDTLPDPTGAHRVYSHEAGAPGPYEFAGIPEVLAFMTARARHARGEIDDAMLATLEAESSTLLEDEYEQSAASGFFVFENVLEAPLPEAWEALSKGQWPEIELLGKPKRVDKTERAWQRELSLRTLGLFLRDRRVVLPEEITPRELGTPHRRLLEHLQMLEESFSLGLIPELIETLALDGVEPVASLASAWMKRFDEVHGNPGDPFELDDARAPVEPPAKSERAGSSPPDHGLSDRAVDRLAELLRGGAADALQAEDDEDDDELPTDDESGADEEPELTPFMRSMRAAALEAIASLAQRELIEIEPKEHEPLALDMANAAADARSAKQMLEVMTRALVESERVDEVYASDDEIARFLKELMEG